MLEEPTGRFTLVGPQVARYGHGHGTAPTTTRCRLWSPRTERADGEAHPLSWMTICVIHSWHFPKHTSQYAFCKLHAAHANRNAVGRARGGSESVPSALSLRHTRKSAGRH